MSGNTHQLELAGFSVVALGSFNPAIFQPHWFSGNSLIRREEAEAATVQIIHKDVSIFSTEWFSLQVTDDRFSVDTMDPTKSLPLRDLAAGTFRILEHTPIGAFGFNGYRHFRFPSEDEWHTFGHHYAPKGSWTGIIANPGMRGLTIQGRREDCDANSVQVKIEPSTKAHPGVFIHVNQHYSLDEKATTTDRIARLLDTLQGSWDAFLLYCDRVCQHLLSEYRKGAETSHGD
jgi:hypothetical protein